MSVLKVSLHSMNWIDYQETSQLIYKISYQSKKVIENLGDLGYDSNQIDLIGFDKDALHVRLSLEEESGGHAGCEFGLDSSGERRFRLNGDIVTRRTELVGKLVTVFFSPDSIQLVRGGPLKRRHFVDQGMSEIDPLLLPALTGLSRVLKQKNHLLRNIKRRAVAYQQAEQEFQAWNKELAVHAAEVCLARMAYARLLEPYADQRHGILSGQKPKLEITYRPSLE